MIARMASNDKRCDVGELQQMAEQLHGYVKQSAEEGKAAHEVESGILQQILRMGRAAMGEFFKLQGDGDVGERVTLPDAREVKRLDQPHVRTYQSIFGPFDLSRAVYGSREGQKIEFIPLDQRLQLPESKFSYVLQDWCQSLGVECAFAKVSATLERFLGLKPPVDSLERMNQQMAQCVGSFRDQLPAPPQAEEGELLVITADNKGVPMRRPGARTPAGMRRKKGEKANKKQMATIGCVYTVDRKMRSPEDVVAALFGEPLPARDQPAPRAQHKRVCSRLSTAETRGQDEVFQWLAAEAARRVADPDMPVPCLMDGQSSLWNDQSRYFEDLNIVPILDLMHVTSRIWEAAYLFHQEGSEEAVAFARQRILRILQGKAGYVIGGLRQMATKRKLNAAKRKKLERICAYLEHNRDRMNYDVYLARGYPIASGVIEGACRHLVKDRMERSGMRWTRPGAQAMLDLRSTFINDQWEAYHAYRIKQETLRLYPHQNALQAVQWRMAA